MILHSIKTKQPSRGSSQTLYALGDLHVGAKHFDRKAFERACDTIANDKNARWIGMGDYAENIVPHDDRWDFESIDPAFRKRLGDLPNACFEYVESKFAPIKDRCIGLLSGNHEDKLRNKTSNDIHAALCLRMGVRNLGYNAAIRWQFTRSSRSITSIIIYATHSRVSSRRDGAKLNRMQDAGRFIMADLLLFGHGHSMVSGQMAGIEFTTKGEFRMRQRVQRVAMCGTFRRTYDPDCRSDYGEQSGFEPTVLGMQKIILRPWAEDPAEKVQVA